MFMKKYILKYKFSFIFNIIAIILESAFSIAIALMLKEIVDTATMKDLNKFKIIIKYSVLVFSINYIIIYLRKIVQARFMKKIMIKLRQDVFKNILKEDTRQFLQKNSSEYVSIINNDLAIIERDYFLGIFIIISSAFSFIFAVITMIKLSIYMAIGVFTTSIVLVIIPQFYNKKLGIYKNDYSNALSNITIKLKDMLLGFEVIKCFNIDTNIEKQFKKCNNDVENKKYRLSVFAGIIATISSFFSFLIFFTAVSIGTYLSIKDMISIGTMIAAMQLMNNILNPIGRITSAFNQFSSVKPIQRKVSKILEYSNGQEVGIDKSSFNNSLEFKNVSFDFNNNDILKDISFKVNKGSKIAIVGASGSGKSTILRILLKYYQDFVGEVLVDGVDIRDIKSQELYNLITMIHQNVFLFDNSIKENVVLYQEYSKEELIDTLKVTGLSGFVEKLPHKENSLIGENASSISGGEKQRIAIARALIRKTPILLLDEINAALDNKISYEIENDILQIKDLTIITVTHKLNKNILKQYDTIIVIKDGNIVEKGTFDDLITLEGHFCTLYTLQYKTEQFVGDIK